MTRKLLLSLLLLALAAVCDPRPAQAIEISRNNPYRSFNISGINYGSMQWERDHRRKKTTTATKPRSRGLFHFLWRRR